jgi:Carboxypeptidase regulatory-like domain
MRIPAIFSGLFLIGIWCLTIRAVDVPATHPTSAPTTGTVVGKVLNAEGNLASDCIVTLQQSAEKMREPIQATTDEKGAFKFEDVAEGEYNLNIRSRDLKQKAIRSVQVFAGKTTSSGNLKMKMK